MARAIFPLEPRVPGASLPFWTHGQIIAQGGAVIAEGVPISIWPASGRATDSGVSYDHEGECHLGYRDAVRQANRSFVVGGTEYKVISVDENYFIPHLALRLREMRSG
jgi:hypothetical protein